MRQPRSVVTQGCIAGLLGAATVAGVFFVIDVASGPPCIVAAGLGHALMRAFGGTGEEGLAAHVIEYAIVHVITFLMVGILAAALVRQSEREPVILAAYLLVFVLLKIAFYIFDAVASGSSVGQSAWYNVTGANMLAAIVMGIYLWRAHPGTE